MGPLIYVLIGVGVLLAVALVLERRPWRLMPEPPAVAVLRTPEFAALPLETQNKQLRDAILTNTGSFRTWVRRIMIGGLIVTVGTVFAVWGVERAAHNACVTSHRTVRSVVYGLTPRVSTKGVHDPATLARINTANAQRKAARDAVRPYLDDSHCPS